ncbi:MAG: sigma 54-interacting transcriptional regulator [Planctomycetota bacterium]|jgi:PAS domain S-box-containing protein
MAAAAGGDCPEREPETPDDSSDSGESTRDCVGGAIPGSLLIASPCGSFRTIFCRYFRAAGYDVEVLHEPGLAARGMAMDRRSLLLILDQGLLSSADADGWHQVLGNAKAAGVPVLAAMPREEREALADEVNSWAEGLLTYPINPEAALRTVVDVLSARPGTGTPARGAGASATLSRETAAGSRPAPRHGDLWSALRSCRPILDQIGDALFVFARTGELVMANEAACRMLGFDRDDILGRSPGIVFSQIRTPPSLEGLDLRKAMSRIAVPSFDTELKTVSGHSIPVSFGTSFLRNAQGGIVGILGIARDIRERRAFEERLRRHNELLEEEVSRRTTEARASEARYRTVLENVATGIIGTDAEGRVESVNRSACDMLGVAEDDARGRPLRDLWTCDGGGCCQEEDGCETTFPKQCRIRNAGGREFTVLRNRSVLLGPDGAPQAYIHTITDLSPQIHAEEELERTRAYLDLIVRGRLGRHKIIGKSRAIRSVLDFVAAGADNVATVLIEGESGTGKELVAETLHWNSSRSDQPYLVLNCATLNETMLESELFGHERGAFTGAVASKKGLLEVTHTGTLFVDEVAEMPLSVQAKVLRVIENGSFRRVGGIKDISVDVRFIAATNRCLAEEVKNGRFREDLFYRLNVLSVEVPPLRERVEDIPLLVGHFLTSASSAATARGRKRFSSKAMDLMIRYAWPGNIRELKNVVERAAILSGDVTVIGDDALPHELRDGGDAREVVPEALKTLKHVQWEHIARVVAATGGNRTRAARVLGLSVRQLRRLLNSQNTSSRPEEATATPDAARSRSRPDTLS